MRFGFESLQAGNVIVSSIYMFRFAVCILLRDILSDLVKLYHNTEQLQTRIRERFHIKSSH